MDIDLPLIPAPLGAPAGLVGEADPLPLEDERREDPTTAIAVAGASAGPAAPQGGTTPATQPGRVDQPMDDLEEAKEMVEMPAKQVSPKQPGGKRKLAKVKPQGLTPAKENMGHRARLLA